MDLVVHVKPTAGAADFPALRQELERLLGSLKRAPAGR